MELTLDSLSEAPDESAGDGEYKASEELTVDDLIEAVEGLSVDDIEGAI